VRWDDIKDGVRPSVMRGLQVADLGTHLLKAITQGDALIDHPLVPFGGTEHRR